MLSKEFTFSEDERINKNLATAFKDFLNSLDDYPEVASKIFAMLRSYVGSREFATLNKDDEKGRLAENLIWDMGHIIEFLYAIHTCQEAEHQGDIVRHEMQKKGGQK